MKRFLRIYITCVRIYIARVTTYRANFLLGMFITLLGNLAFPLITILIYNSGAGFPGWSFHEVLLIQSVFTFSSGITGMCLNGMLWETMGHIKEGTYEIVLLKPLNPLLFLVCSNFEPESFGVIIGGTALFAVAVSNIEVASAAAVLTFILFFVCGCAVMTGFSMLMAATSFKWVANSRIPEIFDSLKTFGKYPLTIFPSVIRNAAAFIIPVGMIGFFPAEALLGRTEPITYIAVLPCLAFMFFGILTYQYMIRLYEGVGG